MDIDKLIEDLSSLTVIEAVQLVRELEKQWGVSSTVVHIAPLNPDFEEPIKEEQTEFDVILENCGLNKLEVIKTLRILIPGLGLKEAKDTAENRGGTLFQGVGKEFAYQAKEQLERVGATIKLL